MEVTLYGLCGCSLIALVKLEKQRHIQFLLLVKLQMFSLTFFTSVTLSVELLPKFQLLKGQLPAALSSNLSQHTCLEVSSNPEHLDSLQIQVCLIRIGADL